MIGEPCTFYGQILMRKRGCGRGNLSLLRMPLRFGWEFFTDEGTAESQSDIISLAFLFRCRDKKRGKSFSKESPLLPPQVRHHGIGERSEPYRIFLRRVRGTKDPAEKEPPGMEGE